MMKVKESALGNKFRPTAALFIVAVLLWSASMGLGNYLQDGLIRKQATRDGVPRQIKALEAKVRRSPDSVPARLELAASYINEAYRSQNGSLVMHALENYRAVLDIAPEQPDALLGLARVSLESGVLDKAAEFFERYLAQRADDMGARNDLAIVFIQLGSLDKAQEQLDIIDGAAQRYFPATLSRALLQRERGDVTGAKELLAKAIELAPNEEVRMRVREVEAAISAQPAAPGATGNSPVYASDTVSPAGLLTAYFRNHQIVGPKITKLTWSSDTALVIELHDFPIDQMPAAARDIFISRAQQNLGALVERFDIRITDEAGRELFAFAVGGAGEQGSNS